MAISSYILPFLGNNFALNPLILDLVIKAGLICAKDPTSSEHAELLLGIKKDIKILVGVEGLFFFAFLIGLMFTPPRKIQASLITWRYLSIWNIGYYAIGVAIIGGFAWISSASVILLMLGVLLTVCYLYFYICLSAIWMLSLVISVEEDDCYGDYAVTKAGEIIERGSVEAISLTFLSTLSTSGITGVLGFLMGEVKQTLVGQLVTGLVLISITRLLSLTTSAAFKDFYYRCKMSHEELVQAQAGAGYIIAPISPQVSADPR